MFKNTWDFFSYDESFEFAKFLKKNKIFGEIKKELYVRFLKQINQKKYKKYIEETIDRNFLELPFDELMKFLIENLDGLLLEESKKKKFIEISDAIWKNKINKKLDFYADELNDSIDIKIFGINFSLNIREAFNLISNSYYYVRNNEEDFIIHVDKEREKIFIFYLNDELSKIISDEVKKIKLLKENINKKKIGLIG
jgi:hypothetical protein